MAAQHLPLECHRSWKFSAGRACARGWLVALLIVGLGGAAGCYHTGSVTVIDSGYGEGLTIRSSRAAPGQAAAGAFFPSPADPSLSGGPPDAAPGEPAPAIDAAALAALAALAARVQKPELPEITDRLLPTVALLHLFRVRDRDSTDAGLDAALGIDLSVYHKIRTTRYGVLELAWSLAYFETGDDVYGGRLQVLPITLSTVWTFKTHSRFLPYLSFGSGYFYLNTTAANQDVESIPGVRWGVGVKVPVPKQGWQLQFELGGFYMEPDWTTSGTEYERDISGFWLRYGFQKRF